MRNAFLKERRRFGIFQLRLGEAGDDWDVATEPFSRTSPSLMSFQTVLGVPLAILLEELRYDGF